MKRVLLILWLGTLVGLLYAGGGRGQQADLDNLKAEINSLKTHRSDVESKLNSLSSSIGDLQRDRDNLKSALDEMRSRGDNERTRLDDVESKLNNSIQKSDIDSVRNDFQNLESNLNKSLRKALTDMKAGRTQDTGDINRLQEDHRQLASAIKSMETALETLKKTQDLHSARLEQVKKQTHIKAWVP